MTCHRDRAQVLAEQYVDESLMNEGIAAIETALADAERRVWDEAAKGLDAHVVYGPSDEAHDNKVGKDGDGTSYNQGVRAAIAWIRAQATQEEAKD